MLTFFTITSENITTMLGYVEDLVTDLTPLLLPILGISLGIFIFWAIISSIKK